MNLQEAKTIAVVGVSNKENRDSHRVAKYLLEQGYTIIPINPKFDELFGLQAYPDLASLPEGTVVDVVNIFRKPSQVLPVVQEAVAMNPKPKLIWMQLGIVNEEAAALAKEAGMEVVMDQCIKVVHRNQQRND